MRRKPLGELDLLFKQLAAATARLRQEPESDQLQCDVCLLTRSVYTEFFSVTELNNELDLEAADAVRRSFQEVLQLIPRRKRYYKSVAERTQDFEDYCREYETAEGETGTGVEDDTHVTSY
jgi:hypothetical protein